MPLNLFLGETRQELHSGKSFRKGLDTIVEYSPVLEAFDREEEIKNLKTLQGAPKSIDEGTTGIPHPSSPPLSSPPPRTPTPQPPHPLFSMMNTMKMPIFKGLGT